MTNGLSLLHLFLSASAVSLFLFASVAQYIGKPNSRHVILSFTFISLSVLVLYPFLLSVGQFNTFFNLHFLHLPAMGIASISTFIIFRLIIEERELGPIDRTDLGVMLLIMVIYTLFGPQYLAIRDLDSILLTTNQLGPIPIFGSVVSGGIALVYIIRGIRLAPSLINQSRSQSILSPLLVGVGLIHVIFAIGFPFAPTAFLRLALPISVMSNILTIAAAMIHFRYPLSLSRWLTETQQQYKKRYYLTEINIPDVIKKLDAAMKTDTIYRESDLTLDKLAAIVQVSRYQLSQLLNSELKVSFTRYVQQYRIEAACQILVRSPHLTILSIAYDVGFNSQSAFQSAFKSLTGLTPSEYRKQYGSQRATSEKI